MNKLDQLLDKFERVLEKFSINKFALIIFAVSTATFLQFAFQKLLDDNTPPLLMFVMVPLVTSWFGGFYIGLYSTIFSIVIADYFFYEPTGSILQTPREIGRMTVFFTQGFIISMLNELRNRSNKKLRETNRKEKKARSEAEQAKKSKDDFISMVSHELNNPITVQKTFLHILKQLAEKDKATKYKKPILQMELQTNRISRLINDLLSVSKLQVGKLSLNKEEFIIDELISSITEEFEAGGIKQKIVIKGKTKKKIYADKERLLQVLNNLLSNAIKYSPNKKKVTITLSESKKHTVISITDQGMGITKKDQVKLFSKYYRAKSSEKKFEGFGMGLYIVSEIIKLHHGKVEVKSTKGKGSTFTVKLPAVSQRTIN